MAPADGSALALRVTAGGSWWNGDLCGDRRCPWPAASSTDARPVLGEPYGVTRDGQMGRAVIASVARVDLLAFELFLRQAGRAHDEIRSLSRLALRYLGGDLTRQQAADGSLAELSGDEALEVPVELRMAQQLIRDDRLVRYLPGDKIGGPFAGP